MDHQRPCTEGTAKLTREIVDVGLNTTFFALLKYLDKINKACSPSKLSILRFESEIIETTFNFK